MVQIFQVTFERQKLQNRWGVRFPSDSLNCLGAKTAPKNPLITVIYQDNFKTKRLVYQNYFFKEKGVIIEMHTFSYGVRILMQLHKQTFYNCF